MKENEFTKEEQILIKKLRNLSEVISPSWDSFERILSSLPRKDVTNYDGHRYLFSMWKFALVAIMIVLAGGYLLFHHGYSTPTTQAPTASQTQSVTAANADATLQQTDASISQAMDKMDQDLNAVDTNGSSESDVNSL